jgi:hypothetical protein
LGFRLVALSLPACRVVICFRRHARVPATRDSAGNRPRCTLAFAGDDDDNQPAPRFRAKTTSGEMFNNESTKGKVVLLEFWTTWCQYCHDEEPLVEQVNKEFSDKGLIVLAIDVAEEDGKEISRAASAHVPHCPDGGHGSRCHVQANVYPHLCRDRPRRQHLRRAARRSRRKGSPRNVRQRWN